MKKMIKFTMATLLVGGVSVNVAACVADTDAVDEEGVTGEAEQELTGPTGTGFFGSDTLFDAFTAAITHSGITGLKYLGTGSGNGEKCLRGTAGGVTYAGATYCNGTKGQTIAPMSRNLNTCQPGEISHRIALDAIALYTKSTQAATNLASADVKGAFCGDGTGSAASCALKDTWGEISSGSSSPASAIKLYRRDDASGTTDTFKSLNSCTAFCSSVKIIVEDGLAGPRLSTDPAGTTTTPNTSSIVTYSGTPTTAKPCLKTDSATTCIGKLAGADINALAYAGLDATATGTFANKKLNIDTKAPTTANIRALITSPATAYKYARFLYLNENPTGPRATAEGNFLKWAFGLAPFSSATAQTFENDLIANGFIACTDPAVLPHTPLACGTTACP
ncbi:hypothetical protein ACMHYB_10985 [Sorangium sp. So ce1128]